MGSRWLSYWFMPGLRTPRSSPSRATATRATSDSRCGSRTFSAFEERQRVRSDRDRFALAELDLLGRPMVLLTAMATITTTAPACTT